ncbi:head decoration protein [Eisenbergiella sp.]
MSRRLDENLGGVGFDNLIADMFPPTDVYNVKLAAGQGVLKRGTLLALKDDSTMAMIDAATTGKANAVLTDPVDTGETTGGEAAAGIAYRTGHFNTNRLIVAEGYEITAADKEALRSAGILLSDAVEV